MEKVRIYAVLEDVGSEYETLAPVKISLKPFDNNCYFVDLEDSEQYDITIDEYSSDYGVWMPYNTIIRENGRYDLITKYFDTDEENPIFLDKEGYTKDEVVYATKCQKYEKGLPVGDPYYDY
jgi:translation elongation factor P/translation initiation factor 5A